MSFFDTSFGNARPGGGAVALPRPGAPFAEKPRAKKSGRSPRLFRRSGCSLMWKGLREARLTNGAACPDSLFELRRMGSLIQRKHKRRCRIKRPILRSSKSEAGPEPSYLCSPHPSQTLKSPASPKRPVRPKLPASARRILPASPSAPPQRPWPRQLHPVQIRLAEIEPKGALDQPLRSSRESRQQRQTAALWRRCSQHSLEYPLSLHAIAQSAPVRPVFRQTRLPVLLASRRFSVPEIDVENEDPVKQINKQVEIS